jgi:hypothetical protein
MQGRATIQMENEMKSQIMLKRTDDDDHEREIAVCVCDDRRGTKGDICYSCGGAIPNSREQADVDEIISRINRPERIICPLCGGYGKGCEKCNGSGKVTK